VVAVVDGKELDRLVLEAGANNVAPGVPYHLVAPPSRHWLGEPNPDYEDERGRAVVIDTSCGAWECCGHLALIEISADEVTWRLDGLEPFRFDRTAYEAALEALAQRQAVPVPAEWDEWEEL
jgi:hypothetical protein